MENYKNIEAEILEMPEGTIAIKKKSPLAAIVFILVGILVFIAGTQKISPYDSLNMTVLTIGICLFLFGIIKLCLDLGSERYVYIPQNKRLKKHKIYISNESKMKLAKQLQEDNVGKMDGYSKEMSSGSILYVLTTNSDYCLAQVLEFSQDRYEPVMPMVVLVGENAKNVDDFIASK